MVREDELKSRRDQGHTALPLAEEAFLASREQGLARILRAQKPGPKGKLAS